MALANSGLTVYRTSMVGAAGVAVLPQLDDQLSYVLTWSGVALLSVLVSLKLIGLILSWRGSQ
ncbi:hypothetical protein N7X57_12855 [Lactiplantibacillus paraplantarum]|uniref:hypothetical protein n=1 Tax=Lactiplantibacillus paraplantarum TaxID=60520 RepID=UPI000514861E|nr:hypothetical protein [Lactiplantibacillus paraplantarum]OAX75288.1 hypothetical protein A0U96_13865 [Lactiplantibacillus plantarum]ALO05100.1 hypothetical protein ASU28_12420 [Lactiplantibacillus paraplantarum]KGE75960.1 hypothetical protein HR47_04245 [Lactiplantibacillus paraplantarum]MCT4456127.1 hypothetical protein [Lactiplantibacillus paraplantarum]MCW1911313.1 hypothetical protein [Lactiplantibacillus paraplantarum]